MQCNNIIVYRHVCALINFCEHPSYIAYVCLKFCTMQISTKIIITMQVVL